MRLLLRSSFVAVGCWRLACPDKVGGVGSGSFNWPSTRSGSTLQYSLFIILCSILTSCTGDPKFQQYFVEGEQLYQANCSNCHQKNGKGLGLVYPPLAPSDYMEANPEKVMCLMKRGMMGEILVNGKSFNQPMPGVPSLTELEIAEIATFIYNSWGHEKGLIEVNSVSKALQACPPE